MTSVVASAPAHNILSKESENYDLRFDDDARLRLAQQSRVTRKLMGDAFLTEEVVAYLRAIAETGRRPLVCDIGTGPGDWMFDVRAQLRKEGINAVLHGYDLFPIHFPSKEKQEADDLSFHELDIHKKETFPSLKEGYDLIHLRYLSIAIAEKQWSTAFENCVSILKPGGMLMWEEVMFDEFEFNDKIKYTSAARLFDMGMEIFKQHGMPLNCDPHVTPLFKANFKNVTRDKFSTTNLDEDWQRLQAKNMGMVTREMLLKQIERGEAAVKGVGFESVEAAQELALNSLKDYENGCLTNMTICRWIGEGFGA
ncbi:hypothetical protein ABW20_dc0107627 [Dactylellina cionopaga]|nr:hypothetical protein ABW20_dc0107627 [Dactylellina cionopaga]